MTLETDFAVLANEMEAQCLDGLTLFRTGSGWQCSTRREGASGWAVVVETSPAAALSNAVSATRRAQEQLRYDVAVWAWAYEVLDYSLIPDALFDAECRRVDVALPTSRPDLDAWFKANFDPSTGMWVHSHPDADKIAYEAERRVKETKTKREPGAYSGVFA